MADKDITTLSGFSFSQAKENIFQHESEILLDGELGPILTIQCIITFALSFKRVNKYCAMENVSRSLST